MKVEKVFCPVVGKSVLITKKYWIHKSSGTKYVTEVLCHGDGKYLQCAKLPSDCIIRNAY